MASRCSQVSISQAEIEVDRNPPRSVRRKRTKKSTVGVRHLCPNLGADGAIRGAAPEPPVRYPHRSHSARHSLAYIGASGGLTGFR